MVQISVWSYLSFCSVDRAEPPRELAEWMVDVWNKFSVLRKCDSTDNLLVMAPGLLLYLHRAHHICAVELGHEWMESEDLGLHVFFTFCCFDILQCSA